MQAALSAIARGDYATARDALVVAWRKRRSPAIADAIDVLDPLAPDAVSVQLAAIVTPRVATSLANLRKLASLDDPRLASWVLAALANPPFCAPTAEPFLVLLATTIDRLDDRRLDAALPALRPILTARITRKPIYTKVLKLIDAAVAHRPVESRSTARERQLELELAAAVAAVRKPTHTVESLLAEVYAHPDDDAPRMVLADALLERGDPRGEFITLQLVRGRNGEPTERERELLKKHGRSWLGPLATVLSFGKGYSGTEFERGFVVKADFIFKIEKKLPLVARDPGWATIEHSPTPVVLLEHAPLWALRSVSLDDEDVAALERRVDPFPAVTRVGLHRKLAVPSALLRRLFPALMRLEVGTVPRDLVELAALGVKELEVNVYCEESAHAALTEQHEALVARLAAMRACFDRLELRAPWFDWKRKPDPVTYVRGADGNFKLS
jgi:uncharacterized protein (TIGR02996 family)